VPRRRDEAQWMKALNEQGISNSKDRIGGSTRRPKGSLYSTP
jgi:hypothetical protein